MSFVVRHKDTGRYLRGHDEWTPEEREALQFTSGLKLIDYIEHGGAHERADAMEIIVWHSAGNSPGIATGASA
jgi:hypothetical protein